MRLHLIASKPTDSVVFGFLPAAARLGLDVTVLTDQPEAHGRAVARARGSVRPGPLAGTTGEETNGPPGASRRPGHETGEPSVRLVGCDPWDVRALIAQLAGLPVADALFSNSDHLQAQTALAADYFGLPGKDWRSALRAKDKALMRRRLAETGTGIVSATGITASTKHPVRDLPYPVVLKPATGVASEDVVLVHTPAELARRSAEILARRPGERLIAEEYLPGTLRTLETLSDGVATWVLGGFRTDLSAPPFFIEERLTWDTPVPAEDEKHVLAALGDLGVSFGSCHTEYVTGPGCDPRLIEVNDRLIGDHGDFLLTDLFGVDLFELALQIYLGQSLPPGPPRARGHAISECVVAGEPGVLSASPALGAQPEAESGVALTYWPLRLPGDQVTLTHTNRDYLGVISALGPDRSAVERSVAALRGSGRWQISRDAQP